MGLEIEDHFALTQLQFLYGHAVDRSMREKLEEIFAADAVFDPSSAGLPIIHGLDAIRERLCPSENAAGERGALNHLATNPAVISEGEDGLVKMITKYIVASTRKQTIVFGEYFDDVVRTGQGWRIKYRKVARHAEFKAELL